MRHPGQDEHQVDAPLGRVLQGGGSTALDDDIEHLPAVQSLAALMLFLSAIYYKHVMSNIFILC